MGSSSVEESDIGDSEIKKYKDVTYVLLESGDHKITLRNTFNCPFCRYTKQYYQKTFLYQHAIGVAKGSCKNPRRIAQHLALANYLETDLANQSESVPQLVSPAPVAAPKPQQDDFYCWPWVGIIANIRNEPKNNNSVGSSDFWLKKFSKYKPREIEIFWDDLQHTAQAVLGFTKDSNGFRNATEFEKSFEQDGQSKMKWVEQKTSPGPNIYGWVARVDDYKSEGPVGNYLRRRGVLERISDPEAEMRQTRASEQNDLSNSALQMAPEDKGKADVNVLRLVKEQKREKEEALQKIFELQKNLNEKQKLDMEIEELKGKLEVMKHMASEEDAAIQEKIHQMNEEMTEKRDELACREDMNNKLLSKERSNGELEEARKELIEGRTDMLSSSCVNIGIKRMGNLDDKPFKNGRRLRLPPDFHEELDGEVETFLDMLSSLPGYPIDKAAARKSYKTIDFCDGFADRVYPDPFPGGMCPLWYVIEHRDKFPEEYINIVNMALLAISHYNEEHDTKFKLIEIQKANEWRTGILTYFITFTAVEVKAASDEKRSVESSLFSRWDARAIIMILFAWLISLFEFPTFSRRRRLEKKKELKFRGLQHLKATKDECNLGIHQTFQAVVDDDDIYEMEQTVHSCMII